MRPTSFLLIICLFLAGCKSEHPKEVPENEFFEAHNKNFTTSGRTLDTEEGIILITSAASVKTMVYGDTITVFLKSDNEQHQYVAVELNEKYQGRYRVSKDTLKFTLPKPDKANTLEIFKETEAANGGVIFSGIRAQKVEKPTGKKRAKIEFIGDSITCGMGADTTEIDCDEGEWFDQHSAYMSYGPRVARQLDVDFEVNCVSGIGMYRNWNDDDQPVMPDVYPYLHLDGNHGKRAIINKEDPPQIVSIALGTNDYSLGDGEKLRLPFSRDKFREKYISFIESVFDIYPETKVALISSPMTGDEEGKELIEILKEIQKALANRPIEVFEFEKMEVQGCTGHPSVEDHQQMAAQLLPFYKTLLNQE